MNSRSINSRGFTLIELLVVVAIIGILAVIAMSRLAHAMYQARYGKAWAELHNFETALNTTAAIKGFYPKDEGVNTLPEFVGDHLAVWPTNPFGAQLDGYDWDCFDYPGPAPFDAVVSTQWCGVTYYGANGIREIDWGDWDNVTYKDWKGIAPYPTDSMGDDLFLLIGRGIPVYWHY